MENSLQYSLRALLLLTALVAITTAAFLGKPSLAGLSTRAGVTIVIASFAILASHATTGLSRAFWTGVAVPTTIAAVASAFCAIQISVAYSALGGGLDAKLRLIADAMRANVAFWCFAPVNGLLCALAYRLLARKTRDEAESRRRMKMDDL